MPTRVNSDYFISITSRREGWGPFRFFSELFDVFIHSFVRSFFGQLRVFHFFKLFSAFIRQRFAVLSRVRFLIIYLQQQQQKNTERF